MFYFQVHFAGFNILSLACTGKSPSDESCCQLHISLIRSHELVPRQGPQFIYGGTYIFAEIQRRGFETQRGPNHLHGGER